MVLFANYKTYAVAADKDGKKMKARGGERVMYTAHNPCWDAKNRFGLAPELPFDFGQIAHIFGQTVPASNMQQPTTSAKSAPVQQTAPPPEPTQKSPAENAMDKLLAGSEPIEEVEGIPDGIPSALADLMRQNHVTESEIQLAVGMRGYFPENMPISDYPPDFVQGVLIGAWAQVFGMIQENRKLPFE